MLAASWLPLDSLCPPSRLRRAFTLIELLVVIGVIGLLLALCLPAVRSAREPSRRSSCANSQRQLATAVLSFESHKRQFPGSWMSHPLQGDSGEQTVNWLVELLPYLERNDLYRCFETEPPAFGNTNQAPYQAILICPSSGITPSSASTRAPISYIVNCGRSDRAMRDVNIPLDYPENGVFFNQTNYGGSTSASGSSPGTAYRVVKQTLPYINAGDGSSYTLLLSETVEPVSWYDGALNPPIPQEGSPAVPGGANEFLGGMLWFGGNDSPLQWDSSRHLPKVPLNADHGGSQIKNGKSLEAYARPSSNHNGGFNVNFCDGHYRFLASDIDYRVYCLLMTPRGNDSRNPGTDELTFRGYPAAGPGAWLQKRRSTGAAAAAGGRVLRRCRRDERLFAVPAPSRPAHLPRGERGAGKSARWLAIRPAGLRSR